MVWRQNTLLNVLWEIDTITIRYNSRWLSLREYFNDFMMSQLSYMTLICSTHTWRKLMFYDASMYWCKNLNFGRVIIMPVISATREATVFFWWGGGGYNFIQLAYYRSFLVFEKILIFILIKFYGSLCNLYLLVFFFYLIWFDKKKEHPQPPNPTPPSSQKYR